MVNCGGFAAGVAHRDVDVLGPDLLGDHVERLLGHLAGQLEVGPLRRPDAELELAGVDPREQLAAQLAAHDDHDGAGRQQVGQHHLAAVRDRPVDDSFESVLDPHEEPRPRLGRVAVAVRPVAVLQQPDAQDRHERAGEQVRRDHRRADGQRERHEQRPHRPLHDERRDEHREDAQAAPAAGGPPSPCSPAARRGTSTACAPSGCGCSRSRPSPRRPGCRWPAPARPGS